MEKIVLLGLPNEKMSKMLVALPATLCKDAYSPHAKAVLIAASETALQTIQTIQAVRSCDRKRRIIVLTDNADDKTEQALYTAGVFAVVHPPFSVRHILNLLDAFSTPAYEQTFREMHTALALTMRKRSNAYLYSALNLAASGNTPDMDLYKLVALYHHTTETATERGIRYAVKQMYEISNYNAILSWLGPKVLEKQPKSLQFINYAVKAIMQKKAAVL